MRSRILIPLAVLLLACFFTAAPADASIRSLVLVERKTNSDLTTLVGRDQAVVMELATVLLLEADAGQLQRLGEDGWAPQVLDKDTSGDDYLIVGLRPDSDMRFLSSAGDLLAERENWLLLRVPRGTSLEPFGEARTFVTRVSHEPLLSPRASAHPEAPSPTGPASAPPKSGTDASPDAANPIVQKIVNSVSNATIDATWSDLASNPPTGTRYSTAQGCRDASQYCSDTYSSLGVPNTFQTWNGSHAPNAIGTHTGAIAPDEVYIVIGHLDDLPSSGLAPGGDDNGSGSVLVLESARALSCWAYRSTLKFINCTGEEQGLLGSTAYATDAQARGENILGVINMDMPGWEGNGIPNPENLDVDYDSGSQWLGEKFAAAATTYGTGLAVDAFLCPSLSASDHYPFWQRGWSAICGITDNEDYCGHGGNYPYYHTSDDTIAHCGNKSFFYSVVRTSIATAAELAQPFKIAFRTPSVACDGTPEILLGDRNLNSNPALAETVAVTVESSTEPTPETILLNEQGISSMMFAGTVQTTSGPAVHGDGLLSVGPGDLVTARYTDALDCDGAVNAPYSATAAVDCAAPAISNVSTSGVTDVQAVVTWTTNEASDGEVLFGDGIPPTRSATGAGGVTAHQVTLTGLTQCTVYYFKVTSSDPAGNTTADDNGGLSYHFETLGNFPGGMQPCHAGRVSLDRNAYACSASVTAQVIDLDLNANPSSVETVAVGATSSTETTPETFLLTETGPNTSTFTGAIPTSPSAVAHDGTLQLRDGDLVTVTYQDANDGTSAAALSFATALGDCTGPKITALAVSDLPPGRVRFTWTTSEPAGSRVDWGATSALGSSVSGSALVTSHTLDLTGLDFCAAYFFKVSSTDGYGNLAVDDRGGLLHAFETGDVPGRFFFDNFETDKGWTLTGEWQRATPAGRGNPSGHDPSSPWSGSVSLGNDLTGLGANSGDYEPSSSTSATSPTLNCQTLHNGRLIIRRWLNVQGRPNDTARLTVQRGASITPLWQNPLGSGVFDSSWSLESYDISLAADGKTNVKIVFDLTADSATQYGGWTIDDLLIKDGSLPDAATCGGCAKKPSFAGVATVTDANACGDSGIALTWQPAAAWGSSGSGTYAVYRDVTPGFTPSSANRLVAGLTALAWTDASAPNGTLSYYIVRAENNEVCSTGPNNGGVQDDNTVSRFARDDVSQPAPGDVGATLLAKGVNDVHLRLDWQPASGATSHRVYRSDNPRMTGAALVGTTTMTLFEDQGELVNANSRYYLVRGVNSCGAEGP